MVTFFTFYVCLVPRLFYGYYTRFGLFVPQFCCLRLVGLLVCLPRLFHVYVGLRFTLDYVVVVTVVRFTVVVTVVTVCGCLHLFTFTVYGLFATRLVVHTTVWLRFHVYTFTVTRLRFVLHYRFDCLRWLRLRLRLLRLLHFG